MPQDHTTAPTRAPALFDRAEGAEFLRLVPQAALFPLTSDKGTPAVKWGQLGPGERIEARDPSQGYGIATGARSGGIVCLDIDMKGGKDGLAALAKLEDEWGELPPTLTVVSPSGGEHRYFIGEGYQSNASKIGEGLDVRGEGGFVRIPGTPHPKHPGHFEIKRAIKPAPLPERWAAGLPRATGCAPKAEPPKAQPRERHALRDLLTRTCKGKGKGSTEAALVWQAWRRIAKAQRFLKIRGGQWHHFEPGHDPVSIDDWFTKSLLLSLAREPEWDTVSGEDLAFLVEPSFELFRADCPQESKWTPAHIARKWEARKPIVAGEKAQQAEQDRLLEVLREDSAAARTAPLPPLLQLGGRCFVLDEREGHALDYSRPIPAVGLRARARDLWPRRTLDVPTKSGTRDMTPTEIVNSYARSIQTLLVEYARTAPEFDPDALALKRGPERSHASPKPVEDPEVAAWLHLLDPTGALIRWIAWCSPERSETTIPALCLVGGAHVGKTLLADALARAQGLQGSAPLKQALSRFNAVLLSSPILFADEGIPRNAQGQPMTEEFRALVTRKDHAVELKGLDGGATASGAVRVVLAANRLDRLFSNRGVLGSNDIAALERRLLVLEVEGESIRAAAAAAQGLGDSEGDPKRLARVAAHFRWIQEHAPEPLPEPQPQAGPLLRELRGGSDKARIALDAIEDEADHGSGWVAVDKSLGLVWIQPAHLPEGAASLRQVEGYVVRRSFLRTHPVTQQRLPRRLRWAALSLPMLREDGRLSE